MWDESTKTKSARGLPISSGLRKTGGRGLQLKPILEATFGADTTVLSSSVIWSCRCGEKRQSITLSSLGFYIKLKQKQAALALAHCPPCWCVGSILNISLQVAEWEQKPEMCWLNLAADWIALTKTFASACSLLPLSSGCRMPDHRRQPSSKFN